MSLFRLLFGLIGMVGMAFVVSTGVPRAWNEFRHSSEFVPALDLRVTSYHCTNWNAVMFNDCKVTYASTEGSGELRDYRFGSAPKEPIHLLRLEGNAAVVTTDVSLATLTNRVLVLFSIPLLGFFFALGLAKRFADA